MIYVLLRPLVIGWGVLGLYQYQTGLLAMVLNGKPFARQLMRAQEASMEYGFPYQIVIEEIFIKAREFHIIMKVLYRHFEFLIPDGLGPSPINRLSPELLSIILKLHEGVHLADELSISE